MEARIAALCGEGPAASWLCEITYRNTGSELLARLAAMATTGIRIVAILLVAYLVRRILVRIVARFGRRMEQRIQERLTRAEQRGAITETQRFRNRRLQRLQAIVGVLRGLTAAAIWTTAVLLVLFELDVRLQPVLAGAGLLGLLVGFGAQQMVRDVIAGIAMLVEDQYGVGDWIEVDGHFGEVERVGLRSTAFRDIDGTVHHVLNGYIQRVGNLSQRWARSTYDVPLALDADIPAAKAIIYKVASDLASDPVWSADIIGPPEIWGVQEFGPEGVKIRLVIPTRPLRNWDITRQLRERIKAAFDNAHIRMPSQLIEIGGQQIGYAVLTRDLDRATPSKAPTRREPVPWEVGPLEHPGHPADDSGRIHQHISHDARTTAADDAEALPDRDLTEQLRIDRGPQPRPD